VIVVEGGSSYNPSAESHAELMARALKEEGERLEREKADEERARLGADIMAARRSAVKSEYADGMIVGPGEVDAAEGDVEVEEEEEEAGPSSKKQKRKTQAQRNKALRRHEAEQLLKLQQSDKKLMKSLPSLKGIEAVIAKREKEQKEGERLADLAKRERERIGLIGGEKVGKHRVKKGVVDVQLGEDLAETLRQIKVSLIVLLGGRY
jgi:nucleolar protein 53